MNEGQKVLVSVHHHPKKFRVTLPWECLREMQQKIRRVQADELFEKDYALRTGK